MKFTVAGNRRYIETDNINSVQSSVKSHSLWVILYYWEYPHSMISFSDQKLFPGRSKRNNCLNLSLQSINPNNGGQFLLFCDSLTYLHSEF